MERVDLIPETGTASFKTYMGSSSLCEKWGVDVKVALGGDIFLWMESVLGKGNLVLDGVSTAKTKHHNQK